MKKLQILLAISTALIITFSQAPSAMPSFVFNLYETIDNTPNGTETETGPFVQLPWPVSAGYVVLLESPNGAVEEWSNWSDVVEFQTAYFGNQSFSFVRLLSDLEGESPNPLWPVFSPGQIPFMSIPETTPPTVFSYGDILFNVWSDAPEVVPGPATLLLFGSGLAGLAGLRRKVTK